MKSINQIFEGNEHLMGLDSIERLIEYNINIHFPIKSFKK